VRTIPPLALRARTIAEPEPDLTYLVVIHRAIRGDLGRLTANLDTIAARGAAPAQARAICRYTKALLAEIRAHHDGEDDILWPVAAAAAGQAVDTWPLTDDHLAIAAVVAVTGQAMASFRAAASGPAAGELSVSAGQLRDMLDEHMADEEGQVFPVLRRYVRAETYRWCEQQMRRKATLPGLRFTAPWLARYSRPDELSRLLAGRGWPARLLVAVSRPGYVRLERRAFTDGGGRP